METINYEVLINISEEPEDKNVNNRVETMQ